MKQIILSVLLLPAATWGSPYGFKSHSLTINAEGSTVTTNRNYDENGQLYVLNSPNQLTESALLLSASYDLSSYWGFHLLTDIKQVTAKTNTYNNSAMGVGGIGLGTDFLLFDSDSFRLIPDIQVYIPLGGAPGTINSTFVNDGAIHALAMLYLSSNFWNINGAVFGGFEWRSADYSSQIPVGAMARINLGRKFFVDAKVFGEISMANDKFTSTPFTRTSTINNYNGGSFMYASLNPSFLAAKAALGWNITQVFSFSAGVRQTFVGYKVADETRFFVNLGMRTNLGGGGGSGHGFKAYRQEEDDKFEVDTENE